VVAAPEYPVYSIAAQRPPAALSAVSAHVSTLPGHRMKRPDQPLIGTISTPGRGHLETRAKVSGSAADPAVFAVFTEDYQQTTSRSPQKR